MKTSSLCKNTPARAPRILLCFHLTLAGVFLIFCVWAASLQPAIQLAGHHHPHLPAGQFEADARTVIAAMRFVLEPEPRVDKNAVAVSSDAEVYTVRALDWPCEIFAYSSNQIELNAVAFTNRVGDS